MREIPLSNGGSAFVDDCDWATVATSSWKKKVQRNTSYAYTTRNGRGVQMHRVILCAPHGMEVDHINHNGLDNRRVNLRIATRSQNAQNRQKASLQSSAFKGVTWHKSARKWQARIVKDQKGYHLGIFADEKDAAIAYDVAARNLFGEFALLNFPEWSEAR